MRKNYNLLILIFFLIISVFVLSKVIFTDKLIGRFIDFTVPGSPSLLRNVYAMNFYSWWSSMNSGFYNSPCITLIPINSVLLLPLLFNLGSWFITRYQLVLTLTLGMFFFYLLSRKLVKKYDLTYKNEIVFSIISGIFFTLNNYFFCELIFGSNVMYLTLSFLPLLIYSIISYFESRKERYFILSLISLVIVSSTIQHLIVAYIILFILFIVYKDIRLFAKLSLIYVLLSLYWILPVIYTAPQMLSNELAADYSAGLKNSSPFFISALINKDYFYNRDLYNLALNSEFLSHFWVINAFLLLTISFISLFKINFFKKIHKKMILFFSALFLISILFIKGAREPFGDFVLFLYRTIPFFNLFRSLQHYISFYIISISVLFIFSGVFLLKQNKKFIYLLLVIVVINAMPWWFTLDVGAEAIFAAGQPSFLGQYYLTPGNEKMYNLSNFDLEFSIMNIPPAFSVFFEAVGNNTMRTQGGDGGLKYGNKGFFATEKFSSDHFLNDLEYEMYTNPDFFNDYKNLFAILNVRYFVLREDITPLFSVNAHSFNLTNVHEAINNSLIFESVEKTDFITIMRTNLFLPHFYTAEDIIIANSNESLLNITQNSTSRVIVFYKNQNNNTIIQNSSLNINNTPIIEFKKINPTKYRIRIHNATSIFPLVLSESFHPSWYLYLTPKKFQVKNDNLNSYSISEIENQATIEELNTFTERGWVSSLGCDFVSKNFQDTIQNNNLPNGAFYETWLLNPIISDEKHLVSNSYSNTWIINPEEVCSNGGCTLNSDGSYDFELVVEFWPQRLFYIGSIISLTFLTGIIAYTLINSLKKKN